MSELTDAIARGDHDTELVEILRAVRQRSVATSLIAELDQSAALWALQEPWVGTTDEKLKIIENSINAALAPSINPHQRNRQGVLAHNQIGKLKDEMALGQSTATQEERDRLIGFTRRLLVEVFSIPPEDQDLADLSG